MPGFDGLSLCKADRGITKGIMDSVFVEALIGAAVMFCKELTEF